MSKTLAELRDAPRMGLPERTYSLCLASKLIGEIRSLVDELGEAEVTAAAQAESDGSKARPRRAAEASPASPIRKRLQALREEMAEHTGILTLRAITPAEWHTWIDAHPPRKEVSRDREWAFGYCNADDLLADLGRFAKAWNGEEFGPGDWDSAIMVHNPATGDLKEICQTVVSMHEMAVDVPKLLSDLLATVGDATG